MRTNKQKTVKAASNKVKAKKARKPQTRESMSVGARYSKLKAKEASDAALADGLARHLSEDGVGGGYEYIKEFILRRLPPSKGDVVRAAAAELGLPVMEVGLGKAPGDGSGVYREALYEDGRERVLIQHLVVGDQDFVRIVQQVLGQKVGEVYVPAGLFDDVVQFYRALPGERPAPKHSREVRS